MLSLLSTVKLLINTPNTHVGIKVTLQPSCRQTAMNWGFLFVA